MKETRRTELAEKKISRIISDFNEVLEEAKYQQSRLPSKTFIGNTAKRPTAIDI